MAVKNNLRELREARNLLQEDIALATGSCSRTIGRIERGERNPSLEIALRIANFFHMKVEDIFEIEDV